MIWPDGHACIKGPWLGWRQSVGEPWFPMGPSKILGGCDVRSQEFVPVQSCHISCQLAMSQSESAYSAIADWHWTTSNTTEVAIRAPYGDMGTSQRRNGDVRTWWHVGKIGPWWPEMTLTFIMVTKHRKWYLQMSVTLSMPISWLCLCLTSQFCSPMSPSPKCRTFWLWPDLWRHSWPRGQ